MTKHSMTLEPRPVRIIICNERRIPKAQTNSSQTIFDRSNFIDISWINYKWNDPLDELRKYRTKTIIGRKKSDLKCIPILIVWDSIIGLLCPFLLFPCVVVQNVHITVCFYPKHKNKGMVSTLSAPTHLSQLLDLLISQIQTSGRSLEYTSVERPYLVRFSKASFTQRGEKTSPAILFFNMLQFRITLSYEPISESSPSR